uniref:DOMON domain-containing protein n=1 Tax=Panagrolaimus sp. ES5 TaxID=591445 RepID=A0AC34FIL7_9BILA
MICYSYNFGLSKYLSFLTAIIFFLPYLFAAPVAVHLNQKLCSFKAGDYSLQWAYEPQSKNVVFVLKQKSDLNNFWTGVGFGDRKKGFIDFIGVFVKNGQIGIADTHIIPDDGHLTPDPSTNVQSIAFDYHNKSVTAKFARALKSPDDKFDQNLDNCQIFNFAINGGSISRSGIVPDFDEVVEKRICDIDKNCIVDIRPHLKSESESSPEGSQKSSKNNNDSKLLFSDQKNVDNDNNEDGMASMVMYWVLYSPSLDISSSASATNKKITKPEFAESVDISGTGDPCSFSGVGYTVNWTYSPETDMVDFSMKHPIRMGKRWSALGIGDTMADMDVAIMFISSGRPKRIRDYFSKSYGVPEEDKQQDWILSRHRTKSIDEMIELGFSRKLETNDNEKDRSLDGCVLFQFAANAGHYGSNFAVRKHEEWPDLYKACDIKKHCIKKDTTASKEESSEKIDKEEISESNDKDDDIIDEADDVIVDEVVSVKKRTEGKTKDENRRQLETSQTENDDGTSTTNLIIPLSGATFSTSNPSENEGANEGATTASEGNAGASEEGVTTVSGEISSSDGGQEEVTTASSAETTVEGGLQAINNVATDASNFVTAETGNSNNLAAETEASNTVAPENGAVAPENGATPFLAAEVEGASANTEAGGITTTSSPSEATTATSDNIETTTPGANVTQQPVHIIPIIGGELNTTMYIPGNENINNLRTAAEGGERNGSTEGAQGGNNETSGSGNNETSGGAANEGTTTAIPAFGIQSTVQERPTTIFSSGESGNNNGAEDVTATPRFGGEENTDAGNNNEVTENASQNSESFESNESTGDQRIPAVTVSLNNLNTTVSPMLGSNEGSAETTIESTDDEKATTEESGKTFGKNQIIETITVPSNITDKLADAGKALTNLANTLNNTEIEVGVEGTTFAATSDSEGGAETDAKGNEITTLGTVEIFPEETTSENNAEGGVTIPEAETSLNSGNENNPSDGTNEEEATTSISEIVTESSGGKKGNKGKGGKGKNKNGKGKNNSSSLEDSTISPSGQQSAEDDATTVVSSDVTTASGIENVEETTIADDSDLTAKQSSEATSEVGKTTVPTSENALGTNLNNASSESAIVGGAEEESTTPASESTKSSEAQGTKTIDSDANGSTVAIGTLPEINTSVGTQTTVPSGITFAATTKSVKVVTGGDSNEAGDTTENLLEILSTTVGRVGPGLRDSAVTEASSSSGATSKVTLPTPNGGAATVVQVTTPSSTTKESPKPEDLPTSEVEGSGESSSSVTSSSSSDISTTPIPGPFDHHKQQLIDELGKDAVGNPKEGCGENHEDYSQCTVYFKNYLGRVQAWANENHERMEDQYGKACTLLSQVQNVTTLCCSIFVETCKGKIEF